MKNEKMPKIEITETAIDRFNAEIHDYAIMYYDPVYRTVWTETDPSNYGNHQKEVYAIAYHGRNNRNKITRAEIFRRIRQHVGDPVWYIEDELEGR